VTAAPAPPGPAKKPKLGERLKTLLAEYGQIALITYFVLFGVVFAGFLIAFKTGIKTESTAGSASLWGASYVAAKVTQPIRILVTLALTPIVARVFRRKPAAAAPPPTDPT
jgi:hypothetical protein